MSAESQTQNSSQVVSPSSNSVSLTTVPPSSPPRTDSKQDELPMTIINEGFVQSIQAIVPTPSSQPTADRSPRHFVWAWGSLWGSGGGTNTKPVLIETVESVRAVIAGNKHIFALTRKFCYIYFRALSSLLLVIMF